MYRQTVDEIDDDIVLCTISSRLSDPTSSRTIHLDVGEPIAVLFAVRRLSPNSFVRFDAIKEDTSLCRVSSTKDILYEIPDEA